MTKGRPRKYPKPEPEKHPLVQGDPAYLHRPERYFLLMAKTVATASLHPLNAGGCVIASGRDILSEGRSLLTEAKGEIDPLGHAIAVAAKRGTPMTAATAYTTRYPFSTSVLQAHLCGIRKIYVVAHDWPVLYKTEFRKAASTARELGMAIEPVFDDNDEDLTIGLNPEMVKMYEECYGVVMNSTVQHVPPPPKTSEATDL